jgi:type II secretory pathway component PulC
LKKVLYLQTAAVCLLTVAALLVLTRQLAGLTWLLFAPQPAATAAPARALMTDLKTAYGLFGTPGQPVLPSGVLTHAGGLTLLGIVASAGSQQGYALLRMEDGTVMAVVEGQPLRSGLTLIEVAIDRVVLERGGVREILLWPSE